MRCFMCNINQNPISLPHLYLAGSGCYIQADYYLQSEQFRSICTDSDDILYIVMMSSSYIYEKIVGGP